MYNISRIPLEITYSKKFFQVQKVVSMTVATAPAIRGGAAIESVFKTNDSFLGPLQFRLG